MVPHFGTQRTRRYRPEDGGGAAFGLVDLRRCSAAQAHQSNGLKLRLLDGFALSHLIAFVEEFGLLEFVLGVTERRFCAFQLGT